MAMLLLESTQTETPDNKILGKDWAGDFQLFCKTYTSSAVKLEIREIDGTWQTAKFNDKEIQLQSAGEVLDIKIARDYEYRLTTKAPGAEVFIAKHN